ncbi:MAG TPA: tetratricopeptide repeat protein [Candidatus Eremiobacteraeota bacterium]|nr:MAG: Serine/threonine-protein kinase B [bacterium ADurb.Bin363]HPZ08848.1 tetratricopeptide repeat protein [Candidatus Eremiobacteraeota bacterium]
MSLFCEKCGYENSDTARFCQGCGETIEIVSQKSRLKEGFILDNRYEIKRLIKAGGMGAVYEAFDHRFKKASCAVKEMLQPSPDTEDQEYILKRFETEGEILHRLRHPHLPVVRDYFCYESRYYLVMDYIEGDDLQTILKNYESEGIPENQIIEWSIQILDALDYLHSQSPPIIYRDLKPANIMIRSSDKKAILIDFGIARTVGPGTENTMTVVGTLIYAPEELLQGKPEPRTDIYSLGATMHCLLTGIVPPTAFSFEPLRKINSGVSEEMEKIVMKALEMKASDRYNSAKEMKRAIEVMADRNSQEVTKVVTESSVRLSTGEIVRHDKETSSGKLKTAQTSKVTTPLPAEKTSKSRKIVIAGIVGLSLLAFVGLVAIIVIFFLISAILSPDYFKKTSEEWYRDGSKLYSKGNYEKALDCFTKAIELDHHNIYALNEMGMALGQLEHYEKANKCFDEILEIDPNYTNAWNNKGWLLLRQKKYNDAINYFNKALEFDPKNKFAWYNRGLTLFYQGKYDQAIKDFDNTLKVDTKYAYAWYYKGQALSKQKKYKEALHCYNKVLKINPYSEDAKRDKDELEKILNK